MKVKEPLKKITPEWVYSTYTELKYLPEILQFRKKINELNKKQRNYTTPRIAFILQFPETWNSLRTVYEAAVQNGSPAIILCIHKQLHFNSSWQDEDQCGTRKNEAYCFCQEQKLQAVNAYNVVQDEWYDLQEFHPDYVFYTRPYNAHLPRQYRTTEVCQYAKVCHIPYGADMGSKYMDSVTLRPDFVRTTYIEFAHSKKNAKFYRKRYSVEALLGGNHCVYLGFPRFDLLCKKNTGKVRPVKTVLWLPRWCVGDAGGNYESHFFVYIEFLLSYMHNHEDLNLIIRPHPLMFGEIIKSNIMTKEEVEKLKGRIKECENIRLDEEKDYIPSFEAADILITDFSSLVIEFFMTGKPIIYCEKKLTEIDSHYMHMYESFYLLSEWSKIEECLNLLVSGIDSKCAERKKVKRKMKIKDNGSIGENIYDYVLNDFKRYNLKTEENR